MNKNRREQLTALKDRIDECKSEMESICGDEQEYFDGMPEAFQNAERGENAQEAINAMEEAVSQLEEAADACETAANGG